MKVLIDTHIALWTMLDSPKLSNKARKIILDKDNEIYYSVVSVWEITIKHHAHPDAFLYDGRFLAQSCDENGFVIVPVMANHVYALDTLKILPGMPEHKDPFDRLLLAQSKAENLMFLTHDSMLDVYGEPFVILA